MSDGDADEGGLGEGMTPGSVIQEQVDRAAAAGGGEVRLAPGDYVMGDALRLRSRVTVRGGPGVVLVHPPAVESPVVERVGHGFFEVVVQDPELFPVGSGLMVADDETRGFGHTFATVVERHGSTLIIDRPMASDCYPRKRARAIGVHSVVEASEVVGAALSDVVVRGPADSPIVTDGCRAAAVYLFRSHGIALTGLDIDGYCGDGVSFQRCTDVSVRDCRVARCAGSGLHPGSGSIRYHMEGNEIVDNARFGVYYCLRTTHSLCRGNVIARNGRAGISIGERDVNHCVVDNRVADNAQSGIEIRPRESKEPDFLVFAGNRLEGNGAPQITVDGRVRDVHFVRNTIVSPPDTAAVDLGDNPSGVTGAANVVDADATAASQLNNPGRAPSEHDLDEMRDRLLRQHGPAAAADGLGCRHLGLAGFPADAAAPID